MTEKSKKTAVISGTAAVITAAGVLIGGFSDPGSSETDSGIEIIPRTEYIDRTILNENDEDGQPEENGECDEEEEKKRTGLRKKLFNLPAVGKAIAALFAGLTLRSLVKKRAFWVVIAIAALIVAADAALSIFSPEYREVRPYALTMVIAVCVLAAAVAVFIRLGRKKPAASEPEPAVEAEPEPEPTAITLIDSAGEFTIDLKNPAYY